MGTLVFSGPSFLDLLNSIPLGLYTNWAIRSMLWFLLVSGQGKFNLMGSIHRATKVTLKLLTPRLKSPQWPLMTLRIIFTLLAIANGTPWELASAHSSDCLLLTHQPLLYCPSLSFFSHNSLITISWACTCYALCWEYSHQSAPRCKSVFR